MVMVSRVSRDRVRDAPDIWFWFAGYLAIFDIWFWLQLQAAR